MKPADAKSPKFDSKWWKANKAKGADADAGFEKALVKYETEKKEFLKKVELNTPSTTTDAIQKALLEVKIQAGKKKSDPKLGVGQKETKEALGVYEKRCDAVIAECKRAAGSPLMTMSAAALVKSAPQFETYCKKRFVSENYNFLSLMAKNPKKERRWYDDFIKAGAKFQVNLPASLRGPFDQIAADIKADPVKTPDNPATWGKAPWEAVVKEIVTVVNRDVVSGFRTYAAGQMVTAKLP
jgi:hypothetical protein